MVQIQGNTQRLLAVWVLTGKESKISDVLQLSPRHCDRPAKHSATVFLNYRAMEKKGRKKIQFLLTVLVFKLKEFQVSDTR